MTPREKLLALAERLHDYGSSGDFPGIPSQDCKAAAKAIRVSLERDHRQEKHGDYFTCSCGFSASGGLAEGVDSCPTLREAAGGDDAEA